MTTNLFRKTRRQHTAGISLVETIVYVAILSIMASAFSLTAVTLLDTFAKVRASTDLAQTATVALERMTRELRFAYDVDTGASTFLVSPGTLALDTYDASDNLSSVLFTLSGGKILMTEGGATSQLTRTGVTVTNLVFTHTPGPFTQAVRIDLTLQKNVRGDTFTENFRTFVVLDGS